MQKSDLYSEVALAKKGAILGKKGAKLDIGHLLGGRGGHQKITLDYRGEGGGLGSPKRIA